jgi:hypothetical protein
MKTIGRRRGREIPHHCDRIEMGRLVSAEREPGSSPRKQQSATPVSKPPTDEGSVATREQIANSKPSTDGAAIKEQIAKSALEGAMFTGRYLLDVVGTTLYLMRKPLSVLLGLFLLSLIVVQAWTTIQGAFAPLCIPSWCFKDGNLPA